MKLYRIICVLFFILLIQFTTDTVHAEQSEEDIYQKRMELYKKTEILTLIPWYYFAAIDQYERNIQKDVPQDQLISITVESEKWFGIGNLKNKNETVITLFNGIGQDEVGS